MIIPTRARPQKLAACLGALARQTLGEGRYEVLVGFDGPDREAAGAAGRAWGEARGETEALRLIDCPREGYNAARNRLLALAHGTVMVSLDDDVTPEPALLEIHVREQQAAIRRARPAIITGYSPFRRYEDDTLFDRLVRETSMVFFYNRMIDIETHLLTCSPAHLLTSPSPRLPTSQRDWGFRHCWGLNFSAPLAAVREVGGFTAVPRAYGYDDLELAWRLRERFRMPVLFRPEARADHDHRFTPRDILEREGRLGESAWHFAGINPVFCREVFGRDIRAPEELATTRELVARDASAAARLEESLLRLADMPASAVDEPHALVDAIYERHLLLKRWTWRRGFLAPDAEAEQGFASEASGPTT